MTAIRAADTDGNPDTEADPNWTTLFATPSHPSYPAAHATFSTTCATVLGLYFGTDAIPFSLSFDGLPGVTRSFASFSAAADEAGQSRIWAGIHWAFDVTAGNAQGTAVASYIFQNCLLPRTSPPPGRETAPILMVTRGFGPTDIGLSASILRPDAAGAGLPKGQPAVYPSPAAVTCLPVVSYSRATEPAHARLDVHPPSRGGSLDSAFDLAEIVSLTTIQSRMADEWRSTKSD